jgi:hypothetical protein
MDEEPETGIREPLGIRMRVGAQRPPACRGQQSKDEHRDDGKSFLHGFGT